MKKSLRIQTKQKIRKSFIKRYLSTCSLKKVAFVNLPMQPLGWLFIFFIAFSMSFSVSAQTIERLDDYLQNAGSTEVSLVDNLLEGENSTLFIYDGTSEVDGNSTPKVVSVNPNSIDILYSNNAYFKDIEIIKIKIRSSEDLEQPIDLDKLSHFENLKYIHLLIAYKICGDTNDTECQKSEIIKLVSSAEGTTSPIILFQVVTLH